MMFLQAVPLPQTHLTFFRVSTSYLVSLANVQSSLDASSLQAGMSASSDGMSLQSDLSSVFPCTQYGFPVAKDLYSTNAGRVMSSPTTYS